MIILGLESSCDDCSAAVIRETRYGPKLLSIICKNQDNLHSPYGGIVPEIAAREHVMQLREIIAAALVEAEVSLLEIDRIAVTQGPGLIGSLLAMFLASKAIAWRYRIDWVGVNHLIGHLNAVRFDYPNLLFPALVLIVSGGHTHLYLATDWVNLKLLQKTRDDAVGESFDKVARMLHLGYPGGPIIDICAQRTNNSTIKFTSPKFRDGILSWSFSGLKTAVKQYIDSHPALQTADCNNPLLQDLCQSFQSSVISWLMKPIGRFAKQTQSRSFVVVGGVACNSKLRYKAKLIASELGLMLAIPNSKLCTDNGAMIASAGALLHPSEDMLSVHANQNLQL